MCLPICPTRPVLRADSCRQLPGVSLPTVGARARRGTATSDICRQCRGFTRAYMAPPSNRLERFANRYCKPSESTRDYGETLDTVDIPASTYWKTNNNRFLTNCRHTVGNPRHCRQWSQGPPIGGRILLYRALGFQPLSESNTGALASVADNP
jgi:hypothetical protein